jgi:hypothetical protein
MIYDEFPDNTLDAEEDATTGEFSKVDISCLLDNGLKPVKQLACGAFGCTYHVCELDDCDLVVKIGNIEQKEIDFMKIASKLGVGPKFYTSFECPVLPTSATSRLVKVAGVILMEKLDESVKSLIPWSITAKSLNLLKALAIRATKARILHRDLHLGNIMTILDKDGEIVDFKLIDFGHAEIAEEEKEEDSDSDIALEPIIAEWSCVFDQIIEQMDNSEAPDPKFNKRVETIQKDLESELLKMAHLSSFDPRCKYYNS